MARSKDVEASVRRMYDAVRAGDVEALSQLIAQDAVLFVGTDAEEWWQDDPAESRAVFEEQLQAAGGFDLFGEDPVGYSEADVGWFGDRPSMRLPDETFVPLRHTGVLRRLNGEWRMVQSHLSVGADLNESLFAREG